MDSMKPAQGPVSFEEVAMYFSEEEWALLNPDQIALYWEVMRETYDNVVSLTDTEDQQLLRVLELMSPMISIVNLLLRCLTSTMNACSAYWHRLQKRKRLLRALHSSSMSKRVCVVDNHLKNYRRQQQRWHALASVHFPRRCGVFPRSHGWWENFVTGVWNDEQWLSNFRMTRTTFVDIVSVLRGRLDRQTTRMRSPVPVEKRVAAALWYLASPNTYSKVGQRFGLGISTVGEIVLEVCFALEAELYHKVVCLGDEISKIMDGFARLGFPHCISAIDGIHIAIRVRGRRINENRNRKSFCSVLLQGAVDHTGRFINTEVMWSEGTNDALMFTKSNLCSAMDGGVFVPGNPTTTLEGVSVPALMIADGAYPMRHWLMKPYSNPRNMVERTFNQKLCRARSVVERAFGRLKSRWRCLSARLAVFSENVATVVTACVILHNICEEKGHDVLIEQTEHDTMLVPKEEEDFCEAGKRHLAEGKRVRDILANFMYTHQRR